MNEVVIDKIDKCSYKPIKTKSAVNGNYTQYESKGDKNKNLSPEEHLDIMRPYFSDMMNNHKSQNGWKIQLTMQINFISSKDPDETRNMHTKSDNIEIIIGNETNDLIEELCESLLQNYQKS